jgi:hypothetical protein
MHLLDWCPVQPLRRQRIFVENIFTVASVILKIILIVVPEIFVVLTEMVVVVVVVVLVLRMAGTGFEVMVGVSKRVVVADVSLFVAWNNWIVDGSWTWSGWE